MFDVTVSTVKFPVAQPRLITAVEAPPDLTNLADLLTDSVFLPDG
jgi:hypothetical protein